MTVNHKQDADDTSLMHVQLELARLIHEGSDPVESLGRALDLLVERGVVDSAWTWFQAGPNDPFALRSWSGLDEELARRIDPLPSGTPLWTRLQRGTESVGSGPAIWRDLAQVFEAAGVHDTAVFPLCADGSVVGGLGAAGGSGSLAPDVLVLLRTVAANLSALVTRLRIEAQLRNNRHNLDGVFRSLPDNLFIVDLDGTIVFHQAAEWSRTGTIPARVAGSDIQSILPGFHSLRLSGEMELDPMTSSTPGPFQRTRLVATDGREVPVEVRITAGIWDDDPVRYAVCRDLSEWSLMKDEMGRLATAIDQSAESVIITNRQGVIQYTNPAFSRLTGYSRDEARGRNPRLLQSGEHGQEFYEDLWGTLDRGETWSGRLVNRTRDGRRFIEDTTISPVRNEQGEVTHYVAVKRDVTRETELTRRLQESQKMEAIGNLAGGIAHDFNNILYALLGFADLALDDLPETHPAHGPVREIARAGARASDLVAKMLAFGRRSDAGHQTLRLQDILQEVLDLARASLPATINFGIDLDPSCGAVLADATQIHQVVLNFCTNAGHAMRADGGDLRIQLKEIVVTENSPDASAGLAPGRWARLRVADTGSGMPPAVAERIFEPYFTTKKADEGTGLGLATVHGIVQNHRGHIQVKTEEGQGTEFTVYFPVMDDVPRSETAVDEVESVLEGRGHVLVIDDEVMIVDVLKRGLERAGFHVTAFENPLLALRAFEAEPGCYDLVVTDQTMPGMAGMEVAAKMFNLRPDVPIIMTTGFSAQVNEDQALAAGIRSFLTKPLKIKALAAEIDRWIKVPNPS